MINVTQGIAPAVWGLVSPPPRMEAPAPQPTDSAVLSSLPREHRPTATAVLSSRPGTLTPPPSPRRSPLAAVPRTLLAEETPPLLAVPDTRQSTTYSCGASALQAVLMYWGREYLETELMERLHTDPDNGTNPRDIVRVASEEGLRAELADHQTLDDLKAAVDAGHPVIIACQAWREGDDLQKPWSEVWDSGHYMVVIGMDDRNVFFEDPSMLGSRGIIPRAEFEERWHDVDDRPYVQSAIYIQGDRPSPPPQLMHVD